MNDETKGAGVPVEGELSRQEWDQLNAVAAFHLRTPWDQLRWYIREDANSRLIHVDDGKRAATATEGLPADHYPDRIVLKTRKGGG
jgi:hypothetical protein